MSHLLSWQGSGNCSCEENAQARVLYIALPWRRLAFPSEVSPDCTVRQTEREMRDEGNCSNGSGCGNGRDEASGAARAAGGGARQPLGRELRRCRCSGSCVGIHLG